MGQVSGHGRIYSALNRMHFRVSKKAISGVFSAVVVVLGTLVFLHSTSQAQVRDEHAVKAAFVYNLTKYVEWPETKNDLVIGVLGNGPMTDVLKKLLDGRSSEARPLHVIVSPNDDQLQRCDILYVTDSSPRQLRVELEKLRNRDILTVGDTESFARDGGIVGLVRVGEQVQLQINLEASRQSHLKISSRLLNIALLVQPTSGGKD